MNKLDKACEKEFKYGGDIIDENLQEITLENVEENINEG